MEAFSLLKYWRTNGGVGGGGGGGFATNVSAVGDGNVGNVNANVRTSTASATTTTIVTAVTNHMLETDEEEEEEESDDGPFFDLEFSLPEGDDEHAKDEGSDVLCGEEEDEDDDSDGGEGEEEDERELKFTLSSCSSGDGTTEDPNVSLSPSDDLFFKGRLVPVEQITEANSKPPQFRVSLMKSATKFRVMMLKFKKSKSDSNAFTAENTESVPSNSKEEQTAKAEQEEKTSQANDKSLMVKVNVEEVPILSLFTRENSSKAPPKKQQNVDESVSSDEKKFSKEAMQRYLKKVKPLYVRVSKRYSEKLKFSGQLSLSGAIKANFAPSPSPTVKKPVPAAKPNSEKESPQEVTEPPLLPITAKGLKQGNLPAGLRVVCKHLGKSRSASAAVAAAPPGTTSSKRRDDSLLQQQDGIQSAILHCKRSFKASRELDSSILSRSTSESSCYGNNSPSSSSANNTVEMKKSL